MIERILDIAIDLKHKSVMLLGPRQVGKSTLAPALSPKTTIQLSDEETFQAYAKDPGLLKRVVRALPESSLIMIDEVQRIPSLVNTVQALVDEDKKRRFILTGSSARKLRRGQANLLPGRVFWKQLSPLLYWEIREQFDLDRALSLGCLPEVYLEPYGSELLPSYAATYIREEIQAEALAKDIGSYGRFLDLAAELSGQYINYSKIASDSEINKETIGKLTPIEMMVVSRSI